MADMLMDAYLEHLRLERKAANTIDSYKYHLTAFLSWVYNEGYELGQMKPMDLSECAGSVLLDDWLGDSGE